MKIIYFFFFLALGFHLSAQKTSISGTIYQQTDGSVLPFVNVAAKNKQNDAFLGTQSDENGYYSLALPAGDYKVEFTYIGFATQTKHIKVSANETQTINIDLEEESTLLNTVVISESKYEKPLTEVTVSMEVLKPRLVESANAQSIDQSLEKVPGVNIIDGQANIRGGSGYSYGSGSRVLLMMDDLPLLSGDAGYTDWSFLPVENVSQVEIIKGAASALYGSAALNGIINLRTEYATSTPKTNFAAYTGIYTKPKNKDNAWWDYKGFPLISGSVDEPEKRVPSYAGASFSHSQRSGKLDWVLGSNISLQDSWRLEDFYRRFRINLNTRYRLNDKMSAGINLNVQFRRSASMFIWGGNSALGFPNATIPEYNYYKPLMASRTPQTKTFIYTIDPYFTYMPNQRVTHKIRTRYFFRGSYNDTNQDVVGSMLYGEYQFQQRFANELTFTAGITHSSNFTDSEIYVSGNTLRSKNTAIYAQADRKFNRLNLSLGARYEANAITAVDSLGDPDTNLKLETEAKPVFRFGANYQVFDFTFLRASFGQGYRFPTIAEKFVTTSIGPINIYSNPYLSSETGFSWEIGIKQGIKIAKWQGLVDVSFFNMRYSDMLEFIFVEIPPGFQSRNVGDTKIVGSEISIAGQGKIGNVILSTLMGYTYINPRYQNFSQEQIEDSSIDKNVLKYRFKHTAKADVEVGYKRVSFAVSSRYFSFMEAIDKSFEDILPGLKTYRQIHNEGDVVFDVRCAYLLNERSKLTFLVDNVLNRLYAMRPALIDAPRAFALRYDVNF
ncbi:MAG: TonB-dependent receptor [Chitinophagales bacterium]|nr:TonB-dependent receptor [Bacteroidota bacterium]MCB9043708.1 TonB-dependent receptor [Chitinophagales bacterium]